MQRSACSVLGGVSSRVRRSNLGVAAPMARAYVVREQYVLGGVFLVTRVQILRTAIQLFAFRIERWSCTIWHHNTATVYTAQICKRVFKALGCETFPM